MTAGKEGERVVQILTDLMKNNREFQIMITVPAAEGKTDVQKTGFQTAPAAKGSGFAARVCHKKAAPGAEARFAADMASSHCRIKL